MDRLQHHVSPLHSTSLSPAATLDDASDDHAALAARFASVRARTAQLAAPLSAEDAMVQSMPDASPAKWHLAHSTWFFEQFVLGAEAGYVPINTDWLYLFNSYYQSVGPMHARLHRGLVSRPGLDEVRGYREEVEARMARAFAQERFDRDALRRIELGLHHEQQHQELLLTDIKHALWSNPLRPAYRDDLAPAPARPAAPMTWVDGASGVVEIGAPPWPGDDDFAFDSESPRHSVLLQPHALASRPVTNAEYRDFIDDGGYRTSTLWLSEGWARVSSEGWRAPLYWEPDEARQFTLGGMRDIDPAAPVTHLSYFEADAYARWAGVRLPTEAEWEHAAARQPVRGNFVEAGHLQPVAADAVAGTLQQLYGDVWEWTASAYLPHPGFRELPGALGEYNGKFMCGQFVLRGGSCASAGDHLRASYRNFFTPPDRWQFSGLRLARDAE